MLAPDPASAQQDQPQAQGQDRPQLGGGAGDVDGGGGEGDVDALPQYHDLENGIVAANQGDPNAKQASAPIAVQSQRGNNRFTRAWYRYCWRRGRRRVVWILVVIFAMLGLALTVYFSLKQAKRHHMGGGHDDDDDSDDDSDDDD